MKKCFTAAFLLMGIGSYFNTALADIKITLPENSGISKINYYYAPILKLATAQSRAERGIVQQEAEVNDNEAVVAIPDIKGGCQFGFSFTENDYVDLFASPGENLNVDIISLNPFDYNISGTTLENDIMRIEFISRPFEDKQKGIMESGNPDPQAMQNLFEQYEDALVEFINGNPDSPAVAYALLALGDRFMEAQEKISPAAKNSILYPLVEAKVESTKKEMEIEQRQKAMEEDGVEAPGFTLKDLQGKDVSLSEFRGKWVILDFWGSWCIWCIKGFPELKEAYEKYSGKLEIIGIDCNESEEAWRDGVKKYELPWVNLYCPSGNSLTSEYEVQGFPTKVIVDPEGKIRNITTGHNPEFFNILARLINQ